MKAIDEIRRENIVQLIVEAGGQVKFAKLMDKSSAQVSQWKNGSKDSKTGRPRGIKSETARYIEVRAKKEPGWLDKDHGAESREQGETKPKEEVVKKDPLEQLLTGDAKEGYEGVLLKCFRGSLDDDKELLLMIANKFYERNNPNDRSANPRKRKTDLPNRVTNKSK